MKLYGLARHWKTKPLVHVNKTSTLFKRNEQVRNQQFLNSMLYEIKLNDKLNDKHLKPVPLFSVFLVAEAKNHMTK